MPFFLGRLMYNKSKGVMCMSYLEKWFNVLNHIDADNTYKAAWGRAIIECVSEEKYESQDDLIVLYEYDIVKKMMKYYWNLYVYFELNHFVPKKIMKRVDALKETFYRNKQKQNIVWYDKVDAYLKQYPREYEQLIKQFMTISNKGFAYQFLRVKRHKIQLYDLDTTRKVIVFEPSQLDIIKTYKVTLLNLIHYQWIRVLITHNKAPNIALKCEASMQDKHHKCNLTKERNTLLRYYHLEGAKDFFTDALLDISDIQVHHVFPHRFLYHCGLWNVVLTSSDNYQKHKGKMPSKTTITKLKKRNLKLYDLLKDTRLQAKIELEDVIESQLVDRYYADVIGGSNEI